MPKKQQFTVTLEAEEVLILLASLREKELYRDVIYHKLLRRFEKVENRALNEYEDEQDYGNDMWGDGPFP